ncbi:hypothetical protein [Flavobacterium algicola]|uniref:hypothetical protein n=1 Tax=Flavobacterium algicola TaxID=556529 RepID=UPI001EFE5258|nr:hypothetical protein [Flavobacterium algicola]MCG9791982.1 hypothetical protein [Flavobacterium algicola]
MGRKSGDFAQHKRQQSWFPEDFEERGQEYSRAMGELKAYRWEANNGGGYYVEEIEYYLNQKYLWNKFVDFK